MMKKTVLIYDHVTVSYGKTVVVRDVSFAVKEGCVLGIVGESGSGKSTLLQAAMGMPGSAGTVRGDIWFAGSHMLDVTEEERRRLLGDRIAMVWQDAGAALCPIRTIGAQCRETVAAHRRMSEADSTRLALDVFQRLGLFDGKRIWNSYPFELSGGMNQRVGVAMAMLLRPQVLLADEPTSALDVYAQKHVLEEIQLLKKMYDTTIVMVTHDMGVVRQIADYVLVLKHGEMVEYGPAAQVLQAPQTAYTRALIEAAPVLRRT